MEIVRVVSAGTITLAVLVGLISIGDRDPSRPPQVAGSEGTAVDGIPQAPRPGEVPTLSSAQTFISAADFNKLDTRFAQIEGKIARLEQRYRELEKRQKTIAEQGLHVRGNSGDDSLPDDSANEASDAASSSEQAVAEQRVAVLESQLTSQASDPLWSPKAVEQISGVFSDAALPGNLLDVTCTATFCRLKVMHTDEGSRDRLTDEIFSALEWQSESYSHTFDNYDGSYNTVLYLSRQGYSLPSQ